jgi:hypothetical protein
MNMRICMMLTFAMILASPVAGQVTSLCDIPVGPKDTADFKIDAATGQEKGLSKYQIKDRVRVVIENLNPFVFKYKIEYEEVEIPEPGLALFQTAVLASSGLTPPPTPTPTTSPRVAGAAPTCSDIFAQNKSQAETLDLELSSKIVGAQTQITTVESGLRLIGTNATAPRAILLQPAAACTALDNAVTDLKKFLSVSSIEPTLRALPGTRKALARKLIHQGGTLDVLKDKLKNSGRCSDAESDGLLKPFKDRLAIYETKVPELETAIGKSQTKLGEIKAERKALGRVVANQLHKIGYLGPFDLPTIVTIKVFQKEKAVATFPGEAYLEYKLRFGGRQRFVMATGIGFSSLEHREFEFSPGFELDDMGQPTGEPTRVINLAEDSDSSLGILLALHTRIADCGNKGVSWCHLTFGASGKLDGDFDVDLLVGWSIGFAEERFFLTLGFYNGRFRELKDGFSVSQALTTGQVETVPVQENRRWRPGVALTYKFK